jgi:hypothetical protein
MGFDLIGPLVETNIEIGNKSDIISIAFNC